MADTSDRMVRNLQLRTLRAFAQLVDKNPNGHSVAKEALAHVIAKHGIGSVEYDNMIRDLNKVVRPNDEPR